MTCSTATCMSRTCSPFRSPPTGCRLPRAASAPWPTWRWGTSGAGSWLFALNHTGTDRVCLLGRDGSTRESFDVPHHDPAALTHVVEQEKARQGFARGLTTGAGDLVVGGSSPATVSLYRRGLPQPLRSVTLTMDVRNAIHGLELWPFDPPAR